MYKRQPNIYALSVTTTPLNHRIQTLHHLSYTLCQFWAYVELLIRESKDIFVHVKYFLHPLSSWPSPLLLAIASPCTCCIRHAMPGMPCWLLMYEPWTAILRSLSTQNNIRIRSNTVVSWKTLKGGSAYKSAKEGSGRSFDAFIYERAPMSCSQRLDALKANDLTNNSRID